MWRPRVGEGSTFSAATWAGAAVEAAYTRKMNHAEEACRREGLVFVPMSWETLGIWHEETVEQIHCEDDIMHTTGSEDIEYGDEIFRMIITGFSGQSPNKLDEMMLTIVCFQDSFK